MADSFDPYHKWLSIPPEEQPPHHYRLLGVKLFEDDLDVIEAAADRQMAHVQTYKTSKRSALSQKLLNELAAARICLLNPATRAAYDAELRSYLSRGATQEMRPTGSTANPGAAAPIRVMSPVPAKSVLLSGQKSVAELARVAAGSGAAPHWRQPAILCGLAITTTLLVAATYLLQSKPEASRVASLEGIKPIRERQVQQSEPALPAPATLDSSDDPLSGSGVQPVRQFPSWARDVVLAIGFDQQHVFQKHAQSYMRDLSGSGNHGRMQGGKLLPGQTGEAMWFNGPADYVEVPDAQSLNPGNGLSIAAWIKAERWQPVLGHDSIVCKHDWKPGTDRGYVLRGGGKESQLTFNISLKSWHDVRTSPGVPARQWLFVVGTFDGQMQRVYVNAVERAATLLDRPRLIEPSPYPLRIGAGTFAAKRNFVGLIDEVVVWRRGLSSAEVQEIFQFGQSGKSCCELISQSQPQTPIPTDNETIAREEKPAVLEVARLKPRSFPVPREKWPRDFPTDPLEFVFETPPKAVNIDFGRLDAVVKESGAVYLAAKWESQGSGGPWTSERLSRDELVASGWRDLGPCPWDETFLLFRRDCKEGEELKIRINKYWPPILIVGTSVQDDSTADDGQPATATDSSRTLADLLQETEPPSLPPRHDLPPAEELAAAEAAFREAFGKELTNIKANEEKRVLARRLLAEAQAPKSSAAAQIVFMQEAARLEADAGRYDSSLEIIAALSQRFVVDDLPLKEQALTAAARFAKISTEFRLLAESWQALSQEAVAADRYDDARRFLGLAAQAAGKASDKPLVTLISQAADEVEMLKAAYDQAAPAQQRAQHGDPQSAAQWGRFLCVYKNDWGSGLKFWAAGPVDQATALAKLDVSEPTTAAQQHALAQGWWTMAEKETEPLPQKWLRIRAARWYRVALPGLSAKDITLARQRIVEAEQLNAPFPTGEWVDLLSLVELPKNSVDGVWTRRRTELAINKAVENARVLVPVRPDSSYDLELRFSLAGGDGIRIVLPVGERSCGLALKGPGRRDSGLGQINDRWILTPKGKVGAGTYKINVRVEVTGNQASIEVDLNSSDWMRWQGAVSAFSIPPNLAVHPRGAIGLGVGNGAVAVFHSARLKVRSGTAYRVD